MDPQTSSRGRFEGAPSRPSGNQNTEHQAWCPAGGVESGVTRSDRSAAPLPPVRSRGWRCQGSAPHGICALQGSQRPPSGTRGSLLAEAGGAAGIARKQAEAAFDGGSSGCSGPSSILVRSRSPSSGRATNPLLSRPFRHRRTPSGRPGSVGIRGSSPPAPPVPSIRPFSRWEDGLSRFWVQLMRASRAGRRPSGRPLRGQGRHDVAVDVHGRAHLAAAEQLHDHS
jgi:hypothetical protein